MNSIKDQKIEEFLNGLASKSPTPGGGAVAALAGAMAAALVEMVCNLTRANSVERIADRAKEIRGQLLELSDEDCAAFEAVMTAYKSKNKARIKTALYKAIEVPQKTRQLSREVGRLAQEVVRIGNKNAHSDAASAEYLAEAAVKAALENIEVNKKTILTLDRNTELR